MLKGIHFLLTYKCLYECAHCFVYSTPGSEGTFTLDQVRKVLTQAAKLKTIDWIYFEGGEPFLFYPLLMESIRMAAARGFKVGIVTNAYFANSVEDATKWLLPLYAMGVHDLCISDDTFHDGRDGNLNPKAAVKAAKKLGMKTDVFSICDPVIIGQESYRRKGTPIRGGRVMFRGRAADKLTKGIKRTNWKQFTECPHEDLVNPERVHVDSFGNVHICQGISMGNLWETSLLVLNNIYSEKEHPICRFIADGGPARLAVEYKVEHDDSYIDACHLCYEVRKKLLDKFPEYLTPKQVYGLD